MINYWVRRRWADGRAGYSIYFMFALTFVNFVLISHRFLIEKDPIFNDMFGDLMIFGIVFVILYVPISILIGFWHRKTQMKIDINLKYLEGSYFAKMFRILTDVEAGRAIEEEVEELRKELKKIEKI